MANLVQTTQHSFHWWAHCNLLQNLQISVPWVLSGGLTATNVRDAVAASHATAVDVSSGIETAPGVKSAQLMSDFAAALEVTPAE